MLGLAQPEQQQFELVVVGQVGALVDVPHRTAHVMLPLRADWLIGLPLR
ncbi:hypothetical protein ACTMU2_11995 [Cupriavidus basilensis]